MADRVTQTVGDARIVVDLTKGGRISSLQIAGHELLVTAGPNPIEWGFYPMAPYAGRVREGRFRFGGETHLLPVTLGPHAIHGTVLDQRWTAEDDYTFECDLGPGWPFEGYARHEIRLSPGTLDLRLEVHTNEAAMPASCGWHPWFRRTIGDASAILDVQPGFMLRREADGVASTERVAPPAGPWDDCFGEIAAAPSIRWPGALTLTVESDCPYWVVFDERDHALCVEPQTAPPNALNTQPFIVHPDRPLVAETTLRWTLDP